MRQYVGLDVSMEETSVCVLDDGGSTVWEGVVESDPAAIVRILHRRAPQAEKVGLETGPTSTWLWHELRGAAVPVVCIDGGAGQAIGSPWRRSPAGEPRAFGAPALRTREPDPRPSEELRIEDAGDKGKGL